MTPTPTPVSGLPLGLDPSWVTLVAMALAAGIPSLVFSVKANLEQRRAAKRAAAAAELAATEAQKIRQQVQPPTLSPPQDTATMLAGPSLYARVEEIAGTLKGVATKDHIIDLRGELSKTEDRLGRRMDLQDQDRKGLATRIEHAINQRGDHERRLGTLEADVEKIKHGAEG